MQLRESLKLFTRKIKDAVLQKKRGRGIGVKIFADYDEIINLVRIHEVWKDDLRKRR